MNNLIITVVILIILYYLLNKKESFNVIKPIVAKQIVAKQGIVSRIPTTTTTTTTPQPTLVQNSSYSCNDNSGSYRYIRGKLYGYPNPTIASQWDTNWGNGAIIDCNNISKSSLNLPMYPTTCDESKATYHILFPDVKAAGADAWSHYTMYGKNEGRPWYGPSCETITTTTTLAPTTTTTLAPTYFMNGPEGSIFSPKCFPAYTTLRYGTLADSLKTIVKQTTFTNPIVIDNNTMGVDPAPNIVKSWDATYKCV